MARLHIIDAVLLQGAPEAATASEAATLLDQAAAQGRTVVAVEVHASREAPDNSAAVPTEARA